MSNFIFETTPRIICEDKSSARLAELSRELGITHALIVTDAGLVAAGLLAPALEGFKAAGMQATVFTDVKMDPPEASVLDAVAAAKTAGIDGVIGFGGGSSMDTAKLVALLVGNPQALPDIYGIGLAKGPRLPLIQVPTTAGTGSEVTPIAIFTTPSNEKKGVVSGLLYPDLALLDGTLTWGLPARITAMTAIDAMVHAIEAYTTRHKKNPISDSMAVKALQLLYANIRKVVKDGADAPARAAMLQGSMLAGISFANAPVAAVHALAYPIGGHFHVPHGLSNALVLVPVMEFNMPAAEALYGELAAAILPGKSKGADLLDAIAELVAEMPMEQRLHDVGIKEADLPMLAEDAMKVQRLLVNNPRDVAYDDALAIYAKVY
ncbi:alcohol dehydrogenase [Paramagnetospirillum marisnigri]|uniref:Alcohol dehydrogenase 2 n=1 Tax=Paramagnetospirillum marisnigri TaxID=1285242 RepID=A0A178MD32_9PROT|nr:iron-containing alcohol dehydrogenase [Paramagnetospirillum marisnigri]OAN46720.1 alcohol dehydrogenase [Paramagnetospirillum marisnigri]